MAKRKVDRVMQGAASGVICALEPLMAEKRISVRKLAEDTGVPRTTLSRWRHSRLQQINLSHAKAVCDALGVRLDELFVLIDADLFTPIRRRRRVLVHVGSSLLEERRGSGREAVGSMDLLAYAELLEFFAGLPENIDVRLVLHPTGTAARIGEDTDAPGEPLLRRDCSHVILGSPRANSLSERIVATLFGATPYCEGQQERFPFIFTWSESRHPSVRSAFGRIGPEEESGIVETRSGELVARRGVPGDSTTTQATTGKDCGLILAFCPEAEEGRTGARAAESDSIIIVACGHGGVGTVAAVRAMIDCGNARLLLPDTVGKPVARVVAADVAYPPAGAGDKNRLRIKWRLI